MSSPIAGAGTALSYAPVNGNNQILPPNATYGGGGNMTADGVHSYTYDIENRLASVDGQTSYVYDAEGNWVATENGNSVTAEYLYDMSGRMVTTVDASANLVRTLLYADGEHWMDYFGAIGSSNAFTEFRLSDQVGTLNANFDQNGNVVDKCINGPFGENMTCNPSFDYTENHYTDKKRDQESNLDYFGARYYGSSLGRFMSPDPSGLYYANPFNPQSLNLYSYGQNNPLTNTDPTGLDCVYINNNTGGFQGFNSGDCNNSTAASANSGYYVDGTVNQISANAQGQVIGYSASSGDGIFDSFAGSTNMDVGPAAVNLNPYSGALSSPGQTVDVNGNTSTGANLSSLNISNQIPAGGLQQSNMAQLRAYHPPTPNQPIINDPACFGAPDAVSDIHNLQRGNAQAQPQASTDGPFGTAIYQRTTQGDRPFGNAAADTGFNAGFLGLDYALAVANCRQGR